MERSPGLEYPSGKHVHAQRALGSFLWCLGTGAYVTHAHEQQALPVPAAAAPSHTPHLRLKVDLSLATVFSSTFWEPLNAAA